MAILGNTSVMLLDVDLNHPHHRNLKNIERQIHNGSKLTRQLLGYAREGRYEVKSIDLSQLVQETADTFGTTRKEIIVHQDFAENLHRVEVDQGQIEQVLLNLYVNAADAMPGGGDLFLKTMNVTDKDMRAKPYAPKPGNYVLLTVRDTGLGMDKKTMDRIFDPFFTTKGFAQGTGLGLASAYGIVKGHGGYIDVYSGKGKGTTFEIYLPATKREGEEEKAVSGEFVGGQDTVLLVDDEEPVLDAGEQMLKRLGYQVLVASSGQEALALFEKDHAKIDMVLLDMVMPGMGGGETYDRMREIDPTVKILLSSGYSIDGEATEILERGCDGFIQKPFDLLTLSEEIRKILDT
jgi:two-component system cell cycle sensor histidine kinase/response regulator CckA